jgi:hypothetical protein
MVRVSAGEVSSDAFKEVEPIPPRYWWLKRIIIASASLIVALVLLRLWWGWYAERLLKAEIDRIVAAGEPIFPEDFDPKEPVPNDQNAVELIEEAMNSLVGMTKAGVSYDDLLNKPETFETDPASVKELLEANSHTFELVHKSRGLRVHWAKSVASSVRTGGGSLSMQRMLCKLLWFSAEARFKQGDHAAAIDSLHDLFWQAHVVNSHPSVISNLVGWAIAGLGTAFVEKHGAELAIDSSAGATGSVTIPTRREQVTSLIAFLLDEEMTRREILFSMYGERACDLDRLNSIDAQGSSAVILGPAGASPFWDSIIDMPRRPLFVLDTIRAVKNKANAIQAAREQTWPAVGMHPVTKEASPTFLLRLTRPLTFTMWGDLSGSDFRSVEIYFRFVADRRMAAIALAIRLFAVDHGSRPAQLSELVPEYLPAIPDDPFSGTQATIQYRADVRPVVLYSVGPDGVDNGGTPRTKWTADGTFDKQNTDLIFHLDGQPRSDDGSQPPSSTQAGDSNDNAKQDKGQNDKAEKPKY